MPNNKQYQIKDLTKTREWETCAADEIHWAPLWEDLRYPQDLEGQT